MINFKQYVHEQLKSNNDGALFIVAREQLLNDFIESTIGEDVGNLEYPEDQIAAEYQRYLRFAEYLMLSSIMNRKYSTRSQAVAYLIAKGMRESFAKAAVDQQYNYDELGDTADLLRGNHEDLTIAHEADREELDQVFHTWNELLTQDVDGIYVDGELMYDLHGNML